MNSIKYVYHYPLSYDDCSIKVYRSIFQTLAINTNFTISDYIYAGFR